MNRIDQVFDRLKVRKEKALIPFITCGDLSIEDTAELVVKLEASGANIVEIGVPFSDPLADGKVIQESYSRALKNGTKVKDVFRCVELIRKKSQVPVILMIYFNVVFCRGVDLFLQEAKKNGVDGIIIPDLPLEERKEIIESCENNCVYLIPLVAPTSKERIKSITQGTKGFVYCVSSNGITGERSQLNKEVNEYLDTVKELVEIPICLGFGISSREVVKEVKAYCDGVIVGSAVVKRMVKSKKEVCSFLEELREELDLK
ncbi:tryptophan synthase subunit alpha [Inconstantimicrobium mannanitabidum]|uniref:Tryptophan synthase alpha chain n=1 Tax=Inconstantimicrobium mannanitabidum TaxID=1604901 RepID=A0ACB5RDG9_9CLOT|nr:tryptophan synthase subunit alpha [Clostridium sp. TW13]GKX67313.1 tryptophan synthase alpha chain [Clostridium sp. TW13]